MLHKVLPIVTDKHVGYPASGTVDINCIESLDWQPQKHGVPDTEKISVRDYDDVFVITRNNFFVKRFETVPCIASALSIREQSVVNGFLGTLKIFKQPLYGFPAAFTQISLS